MKRRKNSLKDDINKLSNREFYLVCLNCGNVRNFTREHLEIVKQTVEESYDAVKDDWKEDDRYNDDSEIEDYDIFVCIECSRSDIKECIDQKDLDEILYKHIDKKWKWHKNELIEKERNKLLGKKMVVNNL